MTNVDIVNDIDCLQLLQHSSDPDIYLRVTAGGSAWLISNTIDGPSGWIESASAGSSCPAHSENAFSERFGRKSWRYYDNGDWHDGDIKLTCSTHSWAHDWNKDKLAVFWCCMFADNGFKEGGITIKHVKLNFDHLFQIKWFNQPQLSRMKILIFHNLCLYISEHLWNTIYFQYI